MKANLIYVASWLGSGLLLALHFFLRHSFQMRNAAGFDGVYAYSFDPLLGMIIFIAGVVITLPTLLGVQSCRFSSTILLVFSLPLIFGYIPLAVLFYGFNISIQNGVICYLSPLTLFLAGVGLVLSFRERKSDENSTSG